MKPLVTLQIVCAPVFWMLFSCVGSLVTYAEPAYTFDVIAKTGDETPEGNIVMSLGWGPSINDGGKVAYTFRLEDGREGILVSGETATRTRLAEPIRMGTAQFSDVAANFYFGDTVQINNQDKIALMARSRDGLFSFVLRLGTKPGDLAVLARNRYVRLDLGSPILLSPFDAGLPVPNLALRPWVTLNNANQVVFSATLYDDPSLTVLAAPRSSNPPRVSYAEDFFLSAPLRSFPDFYPMTADNGNTVVRGGVGTTAPIMVFHGLTLDVDTASFVATGEDFHALGERPGISDDGNAIAFFGHHRSLGVGIFGRADSRDFKLAGLAGQGERGYFSSLSPRPRVGINRSAATSVDHYTAVYLATAPGGVAGDLGPLGLYTSRLDLSEPHGPVIGDPVLVIQAGNRIPALPGTVRDFGLYDPVNARGQLAFWVQTETHQAIVTTASCLLDVDSLAHENRIKHNTALFDVDGQSDPSNPFSRPMLILRRGQPFEVRVRRKCDHPSETELSFEVRDVIEGTTWLIPMYNSNTHLHLPHYKPHPDDVARFLIDISVKTPVGKYEFKAFLHPKGDPSRRLVEADFPELVIVLFNPWALTDEVSGLSWNEIHRLVTEEDIYYFRERLSARFVEGWPDYFLPPDPLPLPWQCDQFDKVCLDVTLELIAELSSERRSSALDVARHLARRVNAASLQEETSNKSNLLPGLLQATWEKNCDYFKYTTPEKAKWPHTISESGRPRITNPKYWSRSRDIFLTYWDTKQSVTYAQCWAFACVLTSMNRCVGIPSRVVTGYNVGIDRNQDGVLTLAWQFDSAFSSEKRILGGVSSRDECEDGLWNFHVWSEAWIHAGPSSAIGWRVLDGTPMQEPESKCGVPRCSMNNQVFGAGPVTHQAIRSTRPGVAWDDASLNLGYFVSSIRPEVEYWLWDPKQEKVLEVPPSPPVEICPLIITHNPAHAKVQEHLTALYRGSNTALRPSFVRKMGKTVLEDLEIRFRPFDPEQRTVDLVWQLEITNQSERDRICDVVLSGAAMEYNGIELGPLDNSLDEILAVPAGETVIRSLVIPADDYLRWLSRTRIFEARLLVSDFEADRHAFHHEWVVFGMPEIAFGLAASEPLAVGHSYPVTVTWTNALPMTISNVRMMLYGSRGVRFSNEETLLMDVPDLAAGDVFEVSIDVAVVEEGSRFLAAKLFADEVSGVYGDILLAVGDPLRLDFRLSASGFPILGFLTAPGAAYQVEFADVLGGGWGSLGSTIAGTGKRIELDDPAWAGQSQRFYRVRTVAQ